MRYVISIFAFFFVIACVQATLLYFALSSSRGLIEENGYEKGLEYQSVIDDLNYTKAHGAVLQLTQETNGDGEQDAPSTLVLHLEGIPQNLWPASLLVVAKKPQNASADFSGTATRCSLTKFCLPLSTPIDGLWLLEIHAPLAQPSTPTYRWKIRKVL